MSQSSHQPTTFTDMGTDLDRRPDAYRVKDPVEARRATREREFFYYEDRHAALEGALYYGETDEAVQPLYTDSLSDFQPRVVSWVRQCLGDDVAVDMVERRNRFAEEAIELIQAAGMSHEQLLVLAHYVFERPKGVVHQEIGGVMTTLGALCHSLGEDMARCGEDELRRVNQPHVMAKVREKHKAKPRGDVLPGYARDYVNRTKPLLDDVAGE